MSLIERIASTGSEPTDSNGVRAQKRSLMLSSAVAATVVAPWPAVYFVFGVPQAAVIPLFYVVMTVGASVHFNRTKKIEFFRQSQMIMITVLPLLVHFALGGFVNRRHNRLHLPGHIHQCSQHSRR